ncbi:MAG: hypothetical protein F2789_12635 [Actinobacteria bacterium]|nr:hypothetical protein [Actinomycetota bacterium]
MAIATAAIGLMAITAVARSLKTEAQVRRQDQIDRLAASGAEEVFGRLAASTTGLAVVTGHPGYGTGAATDDGPWVRFGNDGQINPCTAGNASQACFTVRLSARPDASTATTALIQVTARQCRGLAPGTSSCVRSRQQVTTQVRQFVDHVLWVDDPSTTATLVTGDVIDGPMHANAGAWRTCGSPVVGRTVADPGSGGHEYRIEALTPTDPAVSPYATPTCTATTAATVSSLTVPTADTIALPAPAAADYAALASLVVSAPTTPATIVIQGSQLVINGASPVDLPLNGVLFVDGGAEVSMAVGAPLHGHLTVAASGTITISSDLLLASTTTDLLAVVSTGGNIEIPFVETSRTIQALLVATAAAPAGVISATGVSGCSALSCVAAPLTINGAIVCRQLGAVAEASTDGDVQRGYNKDYHFDDRLAHTQPPYAVTQVRGRWVRLSAAATTPLGVGK